MQLPRPYDNRWIVQGTRGLYREQPGTMYVEGRTVRYHEWEPFALYQKEFDHAWWKPVGREGGSADPLAGDCGGTDEEVRLFLAAARDRKPIPLDLYDSVTMSAVIGMSEESIVKGGAPLPFPDFARGRWKTKQPYFAVTR